MTFLKKLGQVLATGAKIAAEVSGLAPLVLPLLGQGKAAQVTGTVMRDVNDLTAIGTQVLTIETALQSKPGADKLEALIPLVGSIVRTSELVSGKKIGDEARFAKGVQGIAQGMVDVLNSIHPDEVKQ